MIDRGSRGAKIRHLWEETRSLENYSAVRQAFEQMRPETQVERADLRYRIEQLIDWERERSARLSDLRKPGRTLLPLVSRQERTCYRLLSFEEDRQGEFWQESMDATFRGAVATGYRTILNKIGQDLDVALPSPQVGYCCRVLPLAGRGNPDIRLTDRSVALPAAVAFLSAWASLPIPEGVVLTGDLDPESGRVKRVRALESKLRAIISETPAGWLRRYVVPAGDSETVASLRAAYPQIEIIGVETIDEVLTHLWSDWRQRISIPSPALERSFEDADKDYENHRYADALPIYQRLAELTADSPTDRRLHYLSHWRCCATLTHLGRWSAARKHLQRALELGPELRAGQLISNAEYMGPINNFAHLLADAYCFEPALRLLDRAIARYEKDKESLEILGRAYGTRGHIRFFAGNAEAAVPDLERAIECFSRIGALHELPRDYCWLGIAHAYLGERKEGLEAISRGYDILARHHTDPHRRQLTSHFLDYAGVCLDARTGSAEATRASAARALRGFGGQAHWLAPMIRRYLAESMLANGFLDEASAEAAAAVDFFDQLGVSVSRSNSSLLSLHPLAAKTRLTKALIHHARAETRMAEQEIEAAVDLLRRFRAAAPFFKLFLARLDAETECQARLRAVQELMDAIRY